MQSLEIIADPGLLPLPRPNPAQAWAASPSANHGVILIPVPGLAARYQFYASESPHVGWRPKLTVYYRVP